VAAVTLFAFIVRALQLGFVNLHSDEAFFVQIAYQGTFMRSMSIDEPHPPLFLALLQAWMGPAGVTEYAIRTLPVLYGTLLVPLVYQLGRLLGSRPLGLAGAFAAAANPMFIFYAREVRDNGLMAFAGALSFVLLLMSVRRPALLPAYVTAALAALFSHYYAVSLVGLELLIGAVCLARTRGPKAWPWLFVPVALAAAYAPWLAFARSSILNYDVGRGTPAVFGRGLAQTLEAFAVGFSVQHAVAPWACAGVAALLMLGVFALAWAPPGFGLAAPLGGHGNGGGQSGPKAGAQAVCSRRFALAVVLSYALAPILFGAISLLRQTNFNPRYLFAAAPAYGLIVGAALVLLWRWRWPAILAGVFLLALSGLTIRNTGFTAAFQPNGYRELAAFLARHAAPSESMVLDGTSQWPLYWYYGQLRTGLPQRVEFLPRESPADTERSVHELLDSGSVWYLESDVDRYDPRHDVERLLLSEGYPALDVHFAGQRAEYFAGSAIGPLRPKMAEHGPLRLVAATAADRPVSAGRVLGVELSWRREAGPVRPFKLSLRLEDDGALAAQSDSPPVELAGQSLNQRAGLIVPVGTPPGSYALRALAYDVASGQAFGPAIELGPVTVDHAALQQPAAAELPSIGAAVAGLRLEGANVPGSDITPGDRVPITLLWSGGRTAEPVRVTLRLGDRTQEHAAGGGRYPTTAWLPADVVRDVVSLRVPPSLAAGTYPVAVNGVRIGQLHVKAVERSFSPPPLGHVSHFRFGDAAGEAAELLGLDWQAQPGRIRLQIVWQALSEMETSYTAFVHVVAADGRIFSQRDEPPGTDHWVRGQVVATAYELPAPAGDYHIEVGLYDPATGKRLPGCCPPRDSVILAP